MQAKCFRVSEYLFCISCILSVTVLTDLVLGQNTEVDRVPTDVQQLWAGYDPRAEPLDIETLHAWEQDGVSMRIVRYTVGRFKGQPAKVAAVYGHPTGQTKLPGLVQIHGGGQYADSNAVLTNGKRGYATISISWAGRISAPDYRVTPDVVKLFWDDRTNHPDYRVTTDWGAVDGYHAPSRFPGTVFPSVKAHDWTIDSVESPRNSSWFLCALAARRALTFLEQQPEVDAERLGVYGHSMGGKLTVMTAIDDRVKAAAPSCGGISDRTHSSPIYQQTLCDNVYLKQIGCPIMFLSPANDFHGRIDDLQSAIREIQSDEFRMTCSPHHNHQDTSAYEVATQIWFDRHLKAGARLPETPKFGLTFTNTSGEARCTVSPDPLWPILSVDVFLTRHGQEAGERDDMQNTKARFWHHVPVTKADKLWTGNVTVHGDDRPLWAYANVTYRLPKAIEGAGYYYRTYRASELVLSSQMIVMPSSELKQQNVAAQASRSNQIEDFSGEHWRKQWFTYRENEWPIRTHKVYSRRWTAPDPHATLSLTVQSHQSNTLVVGLDDYAATVPLTGGPDVQTILLSRTDFRSFSEDELPAWEGIRELRLDHQDRLRAGRKSRVVGSKWRGNPPQFHKLAWIPAAESCTD